jgi:hypothetical protein
MNHKDNLVRYECSTGTPNPVSEGTAANLVQISMIYGAAIAKFRPPGNLFLQTSMNLAPRHQNSGYLKLIFDNEYVSSDPTTELRVVGKLFSFAHKSRRVDVNFAGRHHVQVQV